MANIMEAFNLFYTKEDTISNNVKLPQIYKNLILSDFEFSLKNISSKTIIINLCEVELEHPNNNFIYNFKLEDSHNQSYSYFKYIMDQCVHIIKIAENNNYSVIVNCAAGINRSCSAIVAYAISKGLHIDDTINYIISQKQNKYKNQWHTLTNTQFVQYLKKMKNEIN